MNKSIHYEHLRDAADCLNRYVELEHDLIALTGINFMTLIDKLKAGYTIEAPKEENLTPHLLDATSLIFGDLRPKNRVYIVTKDIEWEDLTKYEQRTLLQQYIRVARWMKMPQDDHLIERILELAED